MKENPNIHGVNEQGGIIIPFGEVIKARLQRKGISEILKKEESTYVSFSGFCIERGEKFWGQYFLEFVNAGINFEKSTPQEIENAFKKLGYPLTKIYPHTKLTIEQAIRNKQVAEVTGPIEKLGYGNCILFTADGYYFPGKIDHETQRLCFYNYSRET